MCDYSLHGVANRPAKVGDKLVSTNFVNSFTRGFTEVGEPKVAVCLMPGTELKIEDPLKVHRRGFARLLERNRLLKPREIPSGVATFVQVNLDKPHVHHDALKIGDEIISLQHILPGQKATVLQMPVDPVKQSESHEGAEPSRQFEMML